MTVHRRTFEAAKHPKGSAERARLNADTLTSEYYTSMPYLVKEPYGPADAQRVLCRTFRTKAEAIAYADGKVTA